MIPVIPLHAEVMAFRNPSLGVSVIRLIVKQPRVRVEWKL